MSGQSHITGPGRVDPRLEDPPKREDMRGSAMLHQQRRLKQAMQFVHKDSADLLPLDQLRRLGTSKDLQPYSVIQKRLLGGNPGREPSGLTQPPHLRDEGTEPPHLRDEGTEPPHLRDEGTQPPHLRDEGTQPPHLRDEGTQPPHLRDEGTQPPHLHDEGTQPPHLRGEGTQPPHLRDEGTQPPHLRDKSTRGWMGHTLLIPCKVSTQDVTARICTDRQKNLISRSCAGRLGLAVPDMTGQRRPNEELCVDIELGPERLQSTAVIVDDVTEFSIGLQTLITLKSCIDLVQGVLKTPSQEIHFLSPPGDGMQGEDQSGD